MDNNHNECLFAGDDILLVREDERYRLAGKADVVEAGLCVENETGFGWTVTYGDVADIDSREPAVLVKCGLRKAWQYVTETDWKSACRASELLTWSRKHKWCGCCGGKMLKNSDISLKCSECGEEIFPSASPAVLVLVKRGEKALLVHARNFKQNMYALVAGFVESGENLEECVMREVMEETSLEIENVRYYGSQSWPFPNQLMVAFTAEWKSGQINFADDELSAGEWFERKAVPQLPTLPSLSRRVIDAWIRGEV